MPTDTVLEAVLTSAYESFEGSELLEAYCRRHMIDSAGILTIYSDGMAASVAQYLRPQIEDKTVVEIGAGIGLLAFHMSVYAKRVFAIEANPVWSHLYVNVLLKAKPKNATFIFGRAEELAGVIRGDVAVFCTHSGVDSMKRAGLLLAPRAVDVYGELQPDHPLNSFRFGPRIQEHPNAN